MKNPGPHFDKFPLISAMRNHQNAEASKLP
jgi:hypothetical protein